MVYCEDRDNEGTVENVEIDGDVKENKDDDHNRRSLGGPRCKRTASGDNRQGGGAPKLDGVAKVQLRIPERMFR